MKAKTKLNSLLSMLIALAMLLGMLPAMSLTAFAAEPGISITGSTADSSGTGWSYVESTKTLTLSGYNGGYIQGSGLSTLNLVLEGTSTITVDDANAKGIALESNQNLNISGSGSLTINATGGSNLIYGIECNKFTMTSGTVTINANSSKMVYGVNANDSLSVTGGKLTANITGTSDGRGLYCKTGKLTVDSGAEVAVKVTNNGSNAMYGIYNEAYTASVTDNGDIELAGTVTITRDSGSTGSGIVYGIANGGSGGNTDGVISITGGSVTVTNAYYGIAAFTKGHDTAFADVDISGGTVNVTSTLSGSLGIVSWNNGVTISGGTVTANTASPALQLFDQDSANKTGLVKITGGAKVSLTSTGSKTLNVQGDSSNTSTRVHQINLTSGGSVTVKSTSSEETDYDFPVRGYFNLGSSTKITEGSLRSTADGINAGGGKLFQADSTTKQVVVAYSTPAPGANSVSVNGHNFASPTKLYYKNDGTDTTNDSTDYNAYYNPATGVLELKNYNSGRIIIGGSVESDITIKLVGDNVINSDSQSGIVHSNGGDITITADSDATLTINVTNNSDNAYGIACDIPGSYASRSRAITISGKAKVTVNATSNSSAFNDNAVGIFTGGKAAIVDDASFTAICKSSTPSGGLQSAAGIYGYSGVTINTMGKVDIDVSQCSGAYNYGIFGNSDESYNRLEKVSDMTIKWKNGSSGAPVTPPTSFDSAAATHAINVDTTNCVATYRYGTPYTVTVNNGSCDAANRQYLEGDTVTVTADTVSGLTFKKWSSADVTVASETNATTTFIMPSKDVTATANYNLFTTEPSFARTSDTQGTISFTLAATPDSAPKLVEKDSDTVVGNQSFYGGTLERSNTVTNGTGTYDVPAGEYRIAVEYSGVWFYSDVFAVNYAAGVTKLDKPTNLVWDGTTAKWDAVTGADKYRVILYANEDSGSGGFSLISNTDITTNSKDFSEYMLPGMYYYFEVAAYNSANQSGTFSGFDSSAKKQMPGSIGTVTGFAWSGNTISWNAVEGATGYDVWVMKDGVQKGSVRNISTASFDLTSDIASGGDGTYYVSVSAYKLARGNYLAEGNSPAKIIGATPIYSAAVRNVSVNGTIGTAITETQVVIDLTNDTFVSALSGNWITNLPAGLSQSVSYGGTTMAIITISGTPTAASTEQIAITIPADQLIVNTTGLAVTANANAKFNISAPTYTVTINAGANMTLASGNANQSGLSGAMTDTVYTAADGYYFPTDYVVAAVNGISVTRNSYTQITVSGTPTANTTITLDPATAKTLSSIAVTTAPTKVTYTAGEYFNTSGMVVTATYSDSSTKAVTSYTFAPTEALTTGDTSITISYTEGGVTKTATQAITVNAATKTLSSIAVTTAPTKVTYTAGEYFNTSGMVVTATYSDSSTKAVTSYTFAPTEALTTGDTSITISYTEGGVTKTATQAITVNAVLSEFTITFDGNGGTPSVSDMTTTGQKLATLPTATRSGSYSFKGWYTAASSGTKITTDTVFSENTTVYAQWTYTGGGGGGGVSKYTVKFETNGGSTIANKTVTRNTVLTEPTAPTKDGYTFTGWYSDKELKTAYDFSAKVTKSFTLYAKWTEKETEPDKPTEPVEPTEPTDPEWKNPFTDVKKSDWFYTNVEYAVNNKLMNGTTATTFAPNEPLTRGMLVAILYRAEGEPAVNKSIPFSDVDANTYYSNAVVWAQQNGIVNGVTENDFAPDSNITREQIAAIMFRFAKYKGYDVSVGENTNILSYTDAESISEYAISAMQYAVGSGLMKGKTETTINPQDNATRAEIAAILQRFLEANK